VRGVCIDSFSRTSDVSCNFVAGTADTLDLVAVYDFLRCVGSLSRAGSRVLRGRISHVSAVRSGASLVGRIAETVGSDAAAAGSPPDEASAMTVDTAGVRSIAAPEASSIMFAESQVHCARADVHVGRLRGGYVEHSAEALEAHYAGSASCGSQRSCHEGRTFAESLVFLSTAICSRNVVRV